MEKDIELLTKLKEQFIEAMAIETGRALLNVNAIEQCGGYIRALSNAIQMMEEAENDTEV